MTRRNHFKGKTFEMTETEPENLKGSIDGVKDGSIG